MTTETPNAKRLYDLSKHSTMALSCVADMVLHLEHESQIDSAMELACTHDLTPVIISGGSNILLPKRLYALAILPKFLGMEVCQESDADLLLCVGGGEPWHEFVKTCLANGWYGLENLALIPGLVGACPIQNIGAYGVQVSDVIHAVKAVDLKTGKTCNFDPQACRFGYRHSWFKEHAGRYLITQVTFLLHKNPARTITNYGDLDTLAHAVATKHGRKAVHPQDVFDAVVSIRQHKLPDPALLPNCGSFFQNPIITADAFHALAHSHRLPCHQMDEQHVKVPAGWLIEQAGLKGKGVFPILTHVHQALVLTNHAPTVATQDDVQKTQDLIIGSVFDKFGIELTREPVWINDDGSTC